MPRFEYDNVKCIHPDVCVCVLIKIVFEGPINNKAALV